MYQIFRILTQFTDHIRTTGQKCWSNYRNVLKVAVKLHLLIGKVAKKLQRKFAQKVV